MNMDRIEGSWKQLRGGVQQLFGEITNDQFNVMAGRRQCKDGRIQKSYGINRDEAAKQLDALQSHRKMLP